MTTAHEPRRGPGTHLSAEGLSALAEGAQPSAEGAAEHLLECAACRGEVDAMSELLAQFEEWDAPAIPQELAIRIDAALARESAARAATAGHPAAAAAAARASEASVSSEGTLSANTPGSTAPASTSSTSAAKSRRRRWRPAPGLVWSLAALVLIAGGLGFLIKLSSSASGPEAATNSAAGSGAAQPFASKRSPDVFGPGAGGENSLASPSMVASGSPLAVWTDQALSGQRPEASVNTPCLSDPAFKGSHELAVVSGTYDGTDATLVVYAIPSNASTVLAVVYATPCTATSFRVLDKGLVTKPAAGSVP